MEILNPFALLLLPLAVLPFILARWRPKRRVRVVSNLQLWTSARPSAPRSATASRWQITWLVIIQSAFILSIVGALARPVIYPVGPQVAVVLDSSASMGARRDGFTRIHDARRRILEELRPLGSGVRVQVVEAGVTAVNRGTVNGLDGLQALLDQIVPQPGSGQLDAAVDLARSLAPGARVWIASDASEPPNAGGAHWIRVGTPAPNVALTAFEAQAINESRRVQTVIEVTNFGDASSQIGVSVSAHDRVLFSDTVVVEPHETRTLTPEITVPDDSLVASITASGDALDVDNRRYAIVERQRKIRVAIRTSGNVFLEQAVRANPDIVLTDTEANPDVVVCDGCASPPTGTFGAILIPPAQSPRRPVTVDLEIPSHPVVDGVGQDMVVGATPMPMRDGAVLMRAGGVPVVTAREEADRRIVTLNADFSQPAFALTTSFPILIGNAIEWAARTDESRTQLTVGEPVEWALDTGSPISVASPDGRELSVVRGGGHISVTDTALPGFYVIRSGAASDTFAINVDTARESDLNARSADFALPTRQTPPSPASTEFTTWVVMLGMALFVWEWWSAQGHVGWRLLTASGLLAAAFSVTIPLGRAAIDAVYVIDRSLSIPVRDQQSSIARVNSMSETMRDADRAGAIRFGADAVVEQRLSQRPSVADAGPAVVESSTNIERALALARASLDPGGRIVLLSDGNETMGSAEAEAARAATAGIHIDVIPLEGRVSRLLPTVRAVRAPEEVRVGEPFEVTVDVAGPAASHVSIQIRSDSDRFVRDTQLGSDGRGRVSVPGLHSTPGLYTYQAAVESGNDAGTIAGAVVSVVGPPRLLYVSSANTPAAFRAAGFEVAHSLLSSLPRSETDIARFDAIVLDGVEPGSLSPVQGQIFERYVDRFGGGILVLGNRQVLTNAGYASGPLSSLLPIDVRPRRGPMAPRMAFVLAFDKSGSMADQSRGITKIELARESVLRVVDLMPSTDALGVIAFDSEPHVVLPLDAQRRPEDVANALRSVTPNGSTAIGPALDLAGDWLSRVNIASKHVLLVSDGRTSSTDVAQMRAAARSRGFELSVIAIGADADRGVLQAIANESGGRAYFPEDIRQLPELVARAAASAASDEIVEEAFQVRAQPVHPAVRGIDFASPPRLTGYVVGTMKPGADAVLRSHLDDPILAAWQYGLGRVAVYTADATGPWSAGLHAWAPSAQLWTQTMRWLSRGHGNNSLSVRAAETDGGARLRVDAFDSAGHPLLLTDGRVSIRAPSGAASELLLQPLHPGRYEAFVPMTEVGGYQLAVSARDLTGEDLRLIRGVYFSGEAERSALDVNRSLLSRIAEVTDGQVLQPNESPFTQPRPYAQRSVRTAAELASLLFFVTYLLVRVGLTPSSFLTWWYARNTSVDVREAA